MMIVLPYEIQTNISNRVKERREALGLSYDALTKKTGVLPESIEQFEERGDIKFSDFVAISIVLGFGNELVELFDAEKVYGQDRNQNVLHSDNESNYDELNNEAAVHNKEQKQAHYVVDEQQSVKNMVNTVLESENKETLNNLADSLGVAQPIDTEQNDDKGTYDDVNYVSVEEKADVAPENNDVVESDNDNISDDEQKALDKLGQKVLNNYNVQNNNQYEEIEFFEKSENVENINQNSEEYNDYTDDNNYYNYESDEDVERTQLLR